MSKKRSNKSAIKILGDVIMQIAPDAPALSLYVQHDISKPEDELYVSMMTLGNFNIPFMRIQAMSNGDVLNLEIPPMMRVDGYRIEAKIVGDEERQLFVAGCQYMADMFSQLGEQVRSYEEYGASVPIVDPSEEDSSEELGDNILVFKR